MGKLFRKIGIVAVVAAVASALGVGASFIAPQEADAATPYGIPGYVCAQSRPSTGKLVVGDSRCCQLWNYKKSGASFVSLWAGHYGFGGEKWQIDYSARVTKMKTIIKDTLKKKGYCNVYVFATVNDFATPSTFKPFANNCITLAKTLKGVKYKKLKPTVTVMSLVPPKGKSSTAYNNYLKPLVQKSGMKWKSINKYRGGSNDGYLSDNLHYNNTTLKNLWKLIK